VFLNLRKKSFAAKQLCRDHSIGKTYLWESQQAF
jgi:hypothetical protein